jgi:hypothetical protein
MPWYAFGASGNFTVPANVNLLTYVDCIGPGSPGAGGQGAYGYTAQPPSGTGGPGGVGGGGGAFSRKRNVAVTPGQVIPFIVGAPGGYTQFGSNICLAYGANGQTGGQAGSGVGDVRYSGGNGGPGGTTVYGAGQGGGGGGGGGGAAGPNNPGVSGAAGAPGDVSGPYGRGGPGGAGDGGSGGAPGGGGVNAPGAVGGNGQEYGTNLGAGGGGGGGNGGFDPPIPPGQAGGSAGYYGAGGGGGGGQDTFGSSTGQPAGAGGAAIQGLLMIYADPMPVPTVTVCSPSVGPTPGGTPVTISGTDFTSGSTVTIGGVAATSVVVLNSATLTCVTPAHAAGTVDVVVTNVVGPGTGVGLFTYQAKTITGFNMPMLGM